MSAGENTPKRASLPTCDCGEPLDPTLEVSMCRACFDSCEPADLPYADTIPAPRLDAYIPEEN